jgi:hypothetical protein
MNKNRKTSHILNVFQYDDDGHVVLPASLTLSIAPASNDNSGKVSTTAWVRSYVSGLSYLTGNQSISVSGDATGSGTTAITLTLANSGVTAGTYGSTTLVPVVTVDAKGRVTSVTTAAISGSLTFTGDVTGTGTTGTSTGLTLAASGVTAGTYTKVTVDTKGRVTVGASATTSDISEGTNLYYTDARVGAYLTANNYATQSYVGTQVANLVAAAPATLDTLNELAAALGNDPSFATTTATSLGNRLRVDTAAQGLNSTQQSNGRTNLGLGSAALSASGDFATAAQGTKADTAHGWGNHASGGYLTSATAATTYASLTGAYANPAFVASLAYSKITGVPAFLTSYTETDPYRVTSVAVSGTSTKTITLTRADSSTVTTTWTDIDTDTNTYVTSAGFSGGTLTLTRNDAGTVTVSLDGRYYLATNPSGYLTGITSGQVTGALGFTPYNATNPAGYITGVTNISGTAGSAPILTASGGLTTQYGNGTIGYSYAITAGTTGLFSTSDNSNAIITINRHPDNYYSQLGFNSSGGLFYRSFSATAINTSQGWQQIWTTSSLTNLNQLTNGPGYITSYTETDTLASVTGRGASTSSFVSMTGGSKIIVQNSSNGGTDRGLYMWNSSDSNWVIYMATGGATSPSGGTTCNALDGSSSHAIRFRIAGAGNSFIWENAAESCLMSLNGADSGAGGLYVKRRIRGSNGFTLSGDFGFYTSYTGDGLFGATATPNTLATTSNGGNLTLGYQDNGSGLYSPAYGFDVRSTDGRPVGGQVVKAIVMRDLNTGAQPFIVYNNGSSFFGGAMTMGTTGGSQQWIRMGVFSNSQTNSGEAWIGRASDRNAGTMTVQLGGGTAASRSFEVVDYGWSVVMFSVNSANGNVTASGDITAYSDIRVKENIVRIDSALNKIKSINGYYFNRTDVADKTKKIGFIAQEVLDVVPEIVNYNIEQDRYSISYGNTAALLVEAIKEQCSIIDKLSKRIEDLENK